MKEITNAAQFFLIVDFGSTVVHFFLLNCNSQNTIVHGPVEIPTRYFRKSDPNVLFFQGVSALEQSAKRKLIAKDILIVSQETNRSSGVQRVVLISGEEFYPQLSVSEIALKATQEESLEALFSHLSTLQYCNSLLDIGSSATRYFYEGNGQNKKLIAPIGTGASALYVLRQDAQSDLLLRWLTFEMEIVLLENVIANKSVTPYIIPYLEHDLEIELALVREILRTTIPADYDEERAGRNVVLSGAAISRYPNPNLIGLTYLDGVEPEGVNEIYIDTAQFATSLGGVIKRYPELVKDVTLSEIFPHILTTVTVSGTFHEGESLGQAFINFGFDDNQEIKLEAGNIYHIPSAAQTLTLEFSFTHNAFIRGCPFESDANKSVIKKIKTGKRGLIIDTRGRPLPLPRLSAEGRERMRSWIHALDLSNSL